MKKRLIQIPFVIIGILFFGCTDDTPLGVEQHTLNTPNSPPAIAESNLTDGDDFSVGYYNGNIRSDMMNLEWEASEDENFLAYKIFRAISNGPVEDISEGFEGGSLPSGWAEYGDCSGWEITNDVAYEGSYSVQSNPDTCYNGYDYLEKTITVPQDAYIFISFYANGYSYFGGGWGEGRFIINGSTYDYWYQDYGWQYYSYSYYTGFNTEITLQWRWYGDYYTSGLLDNIEISGVEGGEVSYSLIETLNDKNTSSFWDTTLTQNQYYTYKVATIVEQGTYTVDDVEIKTPLWQVPSNINYEILSPEVVEVIWEDNSESESSFKVYVEEYNYWDYENVSSYSSSQDDTSMVVSGLSIDTQYRIGVKAYNTWESTDTTYSNSFQIAFDPPTYLNASAVSDTEAVYLSWNDNTNLEDGFEIFRKVEPNSNYESIGFSNANETYFYDYINTEDFKFDTTYYYKVRAYNNYADTVYTNFSSDEYFTFTLPIPNNLNVNQQGGSKLVDLSWYDSSSLEDGFEIERDTGSGFVLLTTVSANTTSYTDTDTANFVYDETYTYRIRAYNDYSGTIYTNYSNDASVTISEVTFLNEGFEGGTLPDGWIQWTDGGYGWSVSSNYVYEGNYSIHGGGGYNDTEYLEVIINVPEYTYIDISFYQYENDTSGDGDLYINGSYQFDWDSSGGWYEKTTQYYTGSSTEITLQWRYSTSSYGDVYLDNIQVTW